MPQRRGRFARLPTRGLAAGGLNTDEAAHFECACGAFGLLGRADLPGGAMPDEAGDFIACPQCHRPVRIERPRQRLVLSLERAIREDGLTAGDLAQLARALQQRSDWDVEQLSAAVPQARRTVRAAEANHGTAFLSVLAAIVVLLTAWIGLETERVKAETARAEAAQQHKANTGDLSRREAKELIRDAVVAAGTERRP